MKKGDYVTIKEETLKELGVHNNGFWSQMSHTPFPIQKCFYDEDYKTLKCRVNGLWFSQNQLTLYPKEEYPELYL